MRRRGTVAAQANNFMKRVPNQSPFSHGKRRKSTTIVPYDFLESAKEHNVDESSEEENVDESSEEEKDERKPVSFEGGMFSEEYLEKDEDGGNVDTAATADTVATTARVQSVIKERRETLGTRLIRGLTGKKSAYRMGNTKKTLLVRNLSRQQKDAKLYNAETAVLVSSHMLLSDLKYTAWWCILPTASWKPSWDFYIILLALYSCMTAPMEIGFSFSWSGIAYIESLVTISFIIDVCFNFCTAFEDHSGKLVTAGSKIRKRYMSHWFAVDFFASFPFDWFGSGGVGTGSTAAKLLKLPRVFRISHLWKFLESSGSGGYYIQWGFRVFNLTFFLVIIVHWITCIWNVFVDATAEAPSVWYRQLILRGYWQNTTQTAYCVNHPSSALTTSTLGFSTISIKYYASLYFSVLMILGNDVYATTNGERVFAATCSLLGAILQAYVLGQVTMLISNLTAKSRKWREKLDNVSEVMRYMNIDPQIQHQVRLHFEYAFQVYGGDESNKWMWELSDNLHGELLMSQYQTMIENVPFFKNSDTLFVKAIVMQFEHRVYLPEDYIIVFGAIGKEMYFLAHGVTYATNEAETIVFSMMREGAFFGEIALMKECPRTAHVKAATFVNVEVLTKESFDDVINDFPEEKESIVRAANMRLRKNSSKEKSVKFKSDESDWMKSPETPKTKLSVLRSRIKRGNSRMDDEVMSNQGSRRRNSSGRRKRSSASAFDEQVLEMMKNVALRTKRVEEIMLEQSAQLSKLKEKMNS